MGEAQAEATAKADEDWLTRVVYFDSRSEANNGQVAVGCVVLNRSKIKGRTIATEAQKRKQFSDDVTGGTPTSEVRSEAARRKVAQEALNGTTDDPTDGETHFHSFKHGNSLRQWGLGTLTVVIGKHKFFKDILFP